MTCSNAIGVNLVAMGLDDPSSRPRILQIDAPAEAFHRSPRYRPRPEPWKGVTLKVPRLVSISGHVLDPDGRPAADAKVHWGREAPEGPVPTIFSVELQPLHQQLAPKERIGWRNILFGSFLVRPSAAKRGDVGDLRLQRKLEPDPVDIDIAFRRSPDGLIIDGGADVDAAGLTKGDLVLSIAGQSVVQYSPLNAKLRLEAKCVQGCDLEIRKVGAVASTRIRFVPVTRSP